MSEVRSDLKYRESHEWVRDEGFDVPERSLERARRYLGDIESHVSGWPSDYSRRIIVAYATHVLFLMGEKHPEKARRIIEEKGLS